MSPENSSVAIILTTYNGEAHLAEQLQSIAQQTHRQWNLIVSDDGSTDGTLSMIHEFATLHPTILRAGPRLGFAENFMSAVLTVDASYDFFTFADQDDIWDADKVMQGLAAFREVPVDMPALYGTRTRLMTQEGDCYGHSQLFTGPFDFRNALVQCFAGGNTMMINRAAWELLRRASKTTIISHDWWLYQLISGAGGHIMFDPVPRMSYRQHTSSIAGSSAGFSASIARMARLLQGKWRHWNDTQTAALQANAALLTKANRQRLEWFMNARKSSVISRMLAFYRSGVRRLTMLGNVGLLVGALLNRI